MSPARRSVNPQQEALDLGLPEPAPAKTKTCERPRQRRVNPQSQRLSSLPALSGGKKLRFY